MLSLAFVAALLAVAPAPQSLPAPAPMSMPAPAPVSEPAVVPVGVASSAPAAATGTPAGRRPALWLESGLSLGVDAINDVPDLVFDVGGRRVGIVDRNRAAFELTWLPRLAYSFNSGLTLGVYGGIGFTGPSTPQLGLQLDTRGVHVQTVRNQNTAYALSVLGGTFLGLRVTSDKGRYLLATIGANWRGHQNQRLNSKLMVDLRFDVGFPLRRGLYLAVGPNVRLAAFSWGGLSASGMREVSFNLVGTLSYAR